MGIFFDSVFFMLQIVKSLEILRKYQGYGFMPESFALNCLLYIFTLSMNKKLFLILQSRCKSFSRSCKTNRICILSRCPLIILLDLHQVRRYIFCYYQQVRKNYYQLQTQQHFYFSCRLAMRIVNIPQIITTISIFIQTIILS